MRRKTVGLLAMFSSSGLCFVCDAPMTDKEDVPNSHEIELLPNSTMADYEFTTNKDDNLVEIRFFGGKVYRVNPWLYKKIMERIKESDRHTVYQSDLLYKVLEKSDIDHNKNIDAVDVFAITVSKEKQKELITLVNSYLPGRL